MFDIVFSSFAVCPICTVAVGAGLAISKSLGIDDTVISVWIGGLLMSLTIWTINWLSQKKWTFPGFQVLIGLIYISLVFIPLYLGKSLFLLGNSLLGVDKIIFGSMVGALVFIGASEFYQFLKQKNGGKAHFPFEKVVIPVLALALTSLVFYLITNK